MRKLILPLVVLICSVGCSKKVDPHEAKIAAQCLKPQGQAEFPISKFEKLAESTVAPNVKDPLKQYREEVKVFVATAQKLRLGLDSEVANKPLEVQLRVLESDRALETRVGMFLKNVPNVPGMSEKRLLEYKKGFSKMAEGYFAQASHIAQRETEIRKNLKAAETLNSRSDCGR